MGYPLDATMPPPGTTPILRWPRPLGPLLLVPLAWACDSQVEPGYEGEPLAVLNGRATSDEPLPDHVVVAVQWARIDVAGRCDGPVPLVTRSPWQALEIEGEFPNRFTLKVVDSPEPWMTDFVEGSTFPGGESRIAIGTFQAQGGALYARPDLVLVYLENDILQGSVSASFAGRSLEAGFHLLEPWPPCDSYLPNSDPAEGSLDCLEPVALPSEDELATPIDFQFVRYEGGALPRHLHVYKDDCDCNPDATSCQS